MTSRHATCLSCKTSRHQTPRCDTRTWRKTSRHETRGHDMTQDIKTCLASTSHMSCVMSCVTARHALHQQHIHTSRRLYETRGHQDTLMSCRDLEMSFKVESKLERSSSSKDVKRRLERCSSRDVRSSRRHVKSRLSMYVMCVYVYVCDVRLYVCMWCWCKTCLVYMYVCDVRSSRRRVKSGLFRLWLEQL